MRLLAPAKLNLHLRVGKPRADGFHPLLSWMVTVRLFDTLILDRSPDGEMKLACDWPGLACDESNLILKAANALADALAAPRAGAIAHFGISVALMKRIPLGAGLGGGSSDAARILQGLNVLWNAGWSREKLADLASGLGSDLPFFFCGPSAICRGRGELVETIPTPQSRFALLFLPQRPMPTPAVYKRFDELGLGTSEAIQREPDWSSWLKLDSVGLLQKLTNDLEPPAFAIDPSLGQIRATAEQILGRPVRMSGSGSSLFTLYDGGDEAERAARVATAGIGVKSHVVEIAPELADDLNDSGV